MSIQLDKIFPLEVGAWGHKIRYNTTITVGASGHESRNANWEDSLREFNAKYAVKTKPHAAALASFFHTVRGRETPFLIKDVFDYKVSGSSIVIFPGEAPDGVQTAFPLYKYYDDGVGNIIKRVIKYPKNGTVFFAINGTPVSTDDYSVSYSTGIVTFDAAPPAAASILASFEFYTPGRFGLDELDIETFEYWLDSGANEEFRINLPDVPLQEVRGE